MRSQPVDPYTHRDHRGLPVLVTAVAVVIALLAALAAVAFAGRAAATDFHETAPPMVELKPVPLDLPAWDNHTAKAWLCGPYKAYYGPGKTHPVVRSHVKRVTSPSGVVHYVLMPGRGRLDSPSFVRRCSDVFKVVVKIYPNDPNPGPPFNH